MKKVIFALYHDINIDGRSLELLKCAMLIGETTLVSYKPCNNKIDGLLEKNVAGGKRDYLKYIYECWKIIRNEKPDYLFLENNYDAPLIRYAKRKNPNVRIIYDVSELYIGSPYKKTDLKVPRLIRIKQRLSRLMSIEEAKSINLVDVITIPSRERALIFQGFHNLKNTPIVFDNFHRLDDRIDYEKYDMKYRNKLEGKFVIAYGGGIADSRYTFEISESVATLGKDYLLLICGIASDFERNRLNDWITDNNIKNVLYLGMLKKDEWRYLVQKSHITVSAYKFIGLNLIYCASGKVYEGLFEGKPLLSSTNPPFVDLCKTYEVGIATENFASGIVTIRENYKYYTDNVKRYIEHVHYDTRIQDLRDRIVSAIEQKPF